MSILKDLLDLIKFRILFASLLTAILGNIFYVEYSQFNYIGITWMCLGCALIFSAGAALNHYLEVNVDILMNRTKNRPLPSGRHSKNTVLGLIIFLSIFGSLILFYKTNELVLISSILIIFLYNFVYTPIKKISTLNTFIGAIPGAMPVFCGWFLGFNSITYPIIIVFLVLYFWQLPHFFSISWMNKDEYKAANLKMVSVDDKTGNFTVAYMIVFTLAFIIISYIPYFYNVFGNIYCIGVSLLHILLIFTTYNFYKIRAYKQAKHILLATILYPQLILVFVIIEKVIGGI